MTRSELSPGEFFTHDSWIGSDGHVSAVYACLPGLRATNKLPCLCVAGDSTRHGLVCGTFRAERVVPCLVSSVGDEGEPVSVAALKAGQFAVCAILGEVVVKVGDIEKTSIVMTPNGSLQTLDLDVQACPIEVSFAAAVKAEALAKEAST